jgi:hypothetical protein
VGGDFNSKLNAALPHYASYTNAYAGNGADFNHAGNPNIRVNSPALPMPPAFPPYNPPATPAMTPENRSSVQLRYPVIQRPGQPPPTQILSVDKDAYRQSAIDNVFYRGLTPLQAPRCQFRATVAGNRFQFEADLYDLVRAVSGSLPPGVAGAPALAPPDNFFIDPAVLFAFAHLQAFADYGNGDWDAFTQSLDPGQMQLDLLHGSFVTPAGGDPAPGHGPFVPLPALATIPPARRAAEFIKLFVSDHLPVLFRMVI